MERSQEPDHVLSLVRSVLGRDAVGAYLFGSAALGGLRPHSDLDVLVVSKGRTTLKDLYGRASHRLEGDRR